MIQAVKLIDQVSSGRADLSAREAWEVVAPRLDAADRRLLLVGIWNRWRPSRQRRIGAGILSEGRIGEDTVWQFYFRTSDGRRSVAFSLSGDGTLKRRRGPSATFFESDADGKRARLQAIPEDWLDSTEVWRIVRSRPEFRPSLLPDLCSVSFQTGQWFLRRQWCWAARCQFGSAKDGAVLLTVLDVISGYVMLSELTHYAGGVPITKSSTQFEEE